MPLRHTSIWALAELAAEAARRGLDKAKATVGTIMTIVLATTAIGTFSATADEAPLATSSNQLVGSWALTVNRGPTLPPVKSLQTLAKGGGMVTTQNLPPTFGGPAHGAWEKTGAHEYGTTFTFFRYDPSTGANIGSTKLRCTLELARDEQSLTSVCSPEFRSAAGAPEPGSNSRLDRGTGTGTRINVEPVPVA